MLSLVGCGSLVETVLPPREGINGVVSTDLVVRKLPIDFYLSLSMKFPAGAMKFVVNSVSEEELPLFTEFV